MRIFRFPVRALGSAAVAVALVSVPTLADEGQRLAQSCAGCHGTGGAAPGHTIPILGGQTGAYLAEALRAYKKATATTTS